MEKSRTLMERILAALMCLIMLVGLLPAGVISVHAAQTDAFGTVTTKPEDLSINAEDPAKVTVTNDKVVTLTKEKADDSIGRVEGWYVGVEITAPTDYTGGATLDCDRPEGHPNGDSKDLSFDDSADVAGGKVVTLWALITQEWAEKGDIRYVLTLDWDNDGTDDQTVTLTVDADKIVLLDAEGKQVYPKAYGTIVTLPEDLTVEDTDPANITITNGSVISLTKHEADAAIGRLEGWYVGVKIVAPVGYAGGATLDLTRPADHPNGTSTDMDFDANVDVAGVPELTVWALITKEWIEAGDITYVCALDWDNDGTDDQTVTLTVDADRIILLDADDNRVYPDAFATVVSTPAGVVTGKEDMVVLVKDATIKYDAVKEGWFVFATVTGPAHTKETKLDGSPIELVSTYELELQPTRNKNGTYTYTGISGSISGVFTWDGVTQKITLQVENATLEQLQQDELKFEDPAPTDKLVRDGSYTNKASGGSGTGAITYTSSNKTVATVDKNGKVTFKKAGTVTITATKAGDMVYAPAEAKYTLTLKDSSWGLSFQYSNPNDFVFGTNGNVFENVASYSIRGQQTSEGVTYKITASEATGADKNATVAVVDAKTGTLTIYHTGTVTVTATKTADYGYGEDKQSYTLTIVAGKQNLEIEGEQSIIYSEKEDKTYTYTVSGILAKDAAVKATVGYKDPASTAALPEVAVDENGNIVVTPKAGGVFVLQVQVSGDDNYNEAVVEMEITVLIDQTEVEFEKPGNHTGTFNDINNLGAEEADNVFVNPVTGVLGSGAVTYSSSNEAVATVDAEGKVTVHKSGAVTITCTIASDGTYAAQTLEYTLTIEKADQTIAFPEIAPAIRVGQASYQQSALEVGTYFGTGVITYEVVEATLNYKKNSFNNKNGYFELKPNQIGTITIKATKAADDCYNAATATYTLSVTFELAPETSYILSGTVGLDGWYTSNVTITAPEGYLISYQAGFGEADWGSSLMFSNEGINSTGIYLWKKGGGITNQVIIEGIKIDKTAPVNVEIAYSNDVWGEVLNILSFGYYKDSVDVTISASDAKGELATSGVGLIYYNYNGEWLSAVPDAEGKITFSIPAQYRGQVSYYAVDKAGNKSEVETGNVEIIVDDIAPVIDVTWTDAQQVVNSNHYYSDKAVATIVITEDNFFNGEAVGSDDNNPDSNKELGVQAFINGRPVSFESDVWAPYTDEQGNTVDGQWVNTIVLDQEGHYDLVIEYTDRSDNKMHTYTAETVTVDHTDPVISVSPENSADRMYYDDTTEVVVTIKEHNFRAEDVIFHIEAVDAANNAVECEVLYSGWTVDAANPDIHYITLTFQGEANYTLDVEYKDLALREANDLAQQLLTVDKADPESVEITYSSDVWGEVLETLSFGYYQAEMVVTITATDLTSGVERISYNYNGQWLNAEPNAEGMITFNIDKQYRGKVSYYAVDKAGNKSEVKTGNVEIIVDDIAPVIDVTWTDAQQVVNSNHYYSDKAVATIVITEDNFFNGEAVGSDDNNPDSNKELGVQAFINGQLVSFESDVWAPYTDEQGNTVDGQWVNTIVLDQEGHYDLVIEYTDRSDNKMHTYTAETVTVDHTDPVISVSPENSADRMYYDDTTKVDVTIVEHNFRAEDVVFNIVATDVAGNEVAGEVLYSEWSVDAANPDIHYITLTFRGEANYTLDVEYKDLAKREANDLAQQLLTVDKTAPQSLSISYSENLWDTILNAITFGYYDEPVTVTITAVDNTAGIVEFAYEYILNTGVSSVNKGGSGTVEAKQNGNVFTATFQIPASALIATNQFNGYIGFTVVDRSGNTSVKTDKDGNTLIVDNIAPTATITYNAPVQSANGISYYAGDINATISITEANFFPDDVTVTVTKDGVNYDVDVQWTNNSVDLHIGTFMLTEDGDYIITVSYQDRSGNKMNTYTSNELTLDTTVPAINASNIVINSANKDDVYTFTVTVNDTNLDVSTLNAVLQAVIQNQDGTYTVQNIDLGEAVTVVEGQTYTYTVEDLPADGLYTLTCSVKDMSGNTFSGITLDDGKTYESVQFSINRNGSIFLYGDKFTEDLVGQYYVFSVENDVVIVEINVDPIETYSIKLNGKELAEGTDFTTTQTSENGQWSKRTYVISKDLFAAEGEYSLVISSIDKTSTTSFSDIKNLKVVFAVDQTKPVLTISGLENNGRYQTEEQTVTIIPSDDGGRLDSLKVELLDSDGNPLVDDETGADISLRFEMSGDELRKYLEENDGKVTFTIPTCLNAQVRITCSDCAANAQGQTNEYVETFTRVTVSQNALVIFYANTPLFVGAIAGVLALLAAIIVLLTRKKKKA